MPVVEDVDAGNSGCAAFVAVVEPADLRYGNDAPKFRRLNWPRLRRVLPQGKMRSGSVIIFEIRNEGSTKGRLVKDDQVVEALTPDRPDHALNVGSLPGRARSPEYFLYTHGFRLLNVISAEDAISLAQHIARSGIPWKCLDQLVGGPFHCRMGCYVEMEDVAPIMWPAPRTRTEPESGASER